MKFYGREKELEILSTLYEQTETCARMTVLTGRRRVGKTLLSLEMARGHKFVYLFVSRKSEPLLCAEYIDEIRKVFEVPVIGEIRTFRDVFALLIELSRRERYTLIIDEFQEFYSINPAVYSETQHLWDINKERCQLNLILIGSIYSLMHRIFQSSREPLFGRADRTLFIKPFSVRTLGKILRDHDIGDVETLFDFYVFTGGMPRYIDMLLSNSALSRERIIDFVFDTGSLFIGEGKHLLVEEFGKEYGVYFSILELISEGKTARSEIESILERNVGGYMERLENDYSLVARVRPITAKPGSRIQKYRITDNFLTLWFRFIYRHRSAVETGNLQYVRELFRRDYSTYCGMMLERFFHDLFAETGRYNLVGSYWEKGNRNEIDLVAVNDMKKEIVMAEIKLNKARINIEALRHKSGKLLADYPGYTPQWLSLGLTDAEDYLQ